MILHALLLLIALNLPTSDGAAAEPATSLAAPRFTFVDVYIDPHGAPLGAYQFEFIAHGGDAEIVGIEGGEYEAFRDPPYYDPAALQNHNRVILAALSTDDELPSCKTRIARIHLRVERSAKAVEYDAKPVAAASSDGKSIDADLFVEEGVTP